MTRDEFIAVAADALLEHWNEEMGPAPTGFVADNRRALSIERATVVLSAVGAWETREAAEQCRESLLSEAYEGGHRTIECGGARDCNICEVARDVSAALAILEPRK